MRLTLVLLLLIALLIAGILYQRNSITDVKGKLEQTEQALEESNGNLQSATESIDRMQALQVKKQRQIVEQQNLIKKLRLAGQSRREHTQEIHNAPENKNWSDTPLPDDIKRLRKRPDITGTSDYHEYLRHTDAMPVVPASTGEE